MAELADALDSKSGSFGSVGSTPTLGTITKGTGLTPGKNRHVARSSSNRGINPLRRESISSRFAPSVEPARFSSDSHHQKRPPFPPSLYELRRTRRAAFKWWWEPDSNQRTQREQIYSLRALATCISHRKVKKERTVGTYSTMPRNFLNFILCRQHPLP